MSSKRAKEWRAHKAFKIQEEQFHMTVGRNVNMDMVEGLVVRFLIFHLEYISLSHIEFLEWIHAQWKPLVGYCPKLIILVNGWYCFHFLSVEDSAFILTTTWITMNGSLVLSRWHTTFHHLKELVVLRHLWCLLVGFPLQHWSRLMFEDMENKI